MKKQTTTVSDQTEFKQTTPLSKRCEIARQVRVKYPECVPVVLERAASASALTTPYAAKSRFVIPNDMTIGNFLASVRKSLPNLQSHQAIFLFVGSGVLPPTSALVSQIDERFRDEDGFLYITYSGESVFGCFD